MGTERKTPHSHHSGVLRNQSEDDMGKPEQYNEDLRRDNTYLAALRATAPLVPITAVLMTVSILLRL